jgi:sterol desaturase/sphingolipid hydroxylase (fatty acid hydroxylase superfamily)
MTEMNIYTYGIPIIILLIVSEVIYSSINNLKYYKTKDSAAAFGLLLGNYIVNLGTKGSILILYFYLYNFRFLTVNELMPIWMVWILTFITIDFVYYWFHRCSHRVRFLWAVHMNHHSSEEMNFTVALRQAWFGSLTKVPFFISMPLIGFDPLITAVAGVASTLWGVVGHTQWIKKLGPLEYIFVTPSSHRVHHGSNEKYLDKNYGNLLIIWDHIFGTFEKEKEKVIYGIRRNVKTFNPIRITFFEWIFFINDLKYAKDFKEKILCFLGKPEWEPTRVNDET